MLPSLDVQGDDGSGPIPPSNVVIKTEISALWRIPDHQQGMRCTAPRSDDLTVWAVDRKTSGPQVLRPLRVVDSQESETGGRSDRRQRCIICPCESRDGALLVEQGRFF